MDNLTISQEMNSISAEALRKMSPKLYDAINILIYDGQSPEMIQQYALVRRPDITADLLIQIRMTAEHLLEEKTKEQK